jgi:biopolymer transport protein ExbD
MEGVTAPLIDLLFLFLSIVVITAVIAALILMIYGIFFKKKD